MRIRSALILPLLLTATLPARADTPTCNPPSGMATAHACRVQPCGVAFRGGDDLLIGDAAAAAGVSKEAFALRLERAAADAASAARAVALAQGLDTASTERYVAARVAAFVSAEERRLTDTASPETRALLGMTPKEMGTSAGAGWLVIVGALAAVATAVRRRVFAA